MRNPSSKLALVLFSCLALAAVGCGKEKAGGTTKETTPTTKGDPGTTKTAEGGDIKPPEVAIGATRTETFAGAAKKVAETDEYKVSIMIPDSATAGKPTSARVVLNPKKGWKLNDEFPYSLEVTPPAGVKVAKTTQEKKDAIKWVKKDAAEWAISFTPESAGTKAFAGMFEFAVCTDATCNPYSEKLAFNVEVK